MSESPKKKPDTVRPPTVLGWAARIISVLLLLGLVAIIAYHIALPDRDIGLALELKDGKARRQNGQFLVPVEITNRGTKPIRSLKVDVSVGGLPHRIEIDMLAQSETVTYVVAEPNAPKRVSHQIVSYEAP